MKSFTYTLAVLLAGLVSAQATTPATDAAAPKAEDVVVLEEAAVEVPAEAAKAEEQKN